MIPGFLGFPWFTWAGLSLIVAIIYYFVWPNYAVKGVSTGFRFFAVRYGHTLTWALIALNFFLRGLSPTLDETAYTIALAGGISYFTFMVMTFIMK
ncbi:MAG: hypothetical protein KA480_02585 [Anaerolineales bacterium]|nr:hypothetical protein [Anaerolineales bacterium]MBP8163954.1 hypothetical protein [Anaerolineales bacterium]